MGDAMVLAVRSQEPLLNGGQVHGYGNAEVTPVLLPSLVTKELLSKEILGR